MKPVARFALALQPWHTGARPLHSRLIVDGRAADVALPGWRLRFQAELDEGFFLVTDLGYQGSQTIVLQLLDIRLRCLEWRALGPLFSLFPIDHRPCRVRSAAASGPRALLLTSEDERRWKVQIRPYRIPLLLPRIRIEPL